MYLHVCEIPKCLHFLICTCMSFMRVLCPVASGPLLMCVSHICVLYAQHNVLVGARASVLSQEPSCLQQCCLARHCQVTCPPCLTVVVGQTDAHSVWTMPHQLLWPVGELLGWICLFLFNKGFVTHMLWIKCKCTQLNVKGSRLYFCLAVSVCVGCPCLHFEDWS